MIEAVPTFVPMNTGLGLGPVLPTGKWGPSVAIRRFSVLQSAQAMPGPSLCPGVPVPFVHSCAQRMYGGISYPQGRRETDKAEQFLIPITPLFCRIVCTTVPQPFCT